MSELVENRRGELKIPVRVDRQAAGEKIAKEDKVMEAYHSMTFTILCGGQLHEPALERS